jgi:hypothetical protein
MQKSWYLVAGALVFVLLGTSPIGAQPPATITLVDPGSGANLAGIYTSPYDGSINGGSTLPIICDDFADETYQSETWQANVTSLGSLGQSTEDSTLRWGYSSTNPAGNVSGSVTLGSSTYTWSLSQTAAYEVAALLSIEILQSTPPGSTAQQDLSYALWGLFDPTGTAGDPGAFAWLSSPSFGSEYTSNESQAISDLSAAVAEVQSGEVNGEGLGSYLSNYKVTIYSYDPPAPSGTGITPTCGSGTCPPPPQEFITVTTPEPSTPVLMAIDLLGFMALVGFLRKRMARSV